MTGFNLYSQKYALVDTSRPGYLNDDAFAKQCIVSYKNHDYLSLEKYLNSWTTLKGPNEPNQRALTLLAIRNGSFDINKNVNIIENMLICRAADKKFSSGDTVFILPYRYFTPYTELNDDYTAFTKNMAFDLTNSPVNDPDQELLLKYYSGEYDTTLYLLNTKKYRQTQLGKYYKKYAKDIIRDSFFVKFGIIMGYWIPQSDLSVVGNHPSLGFQFGFRKFKGWGVNITMVNRYGNSADSMQLQFRGDTLIWTKNFMGGYYGVDFTKTLFYSVNDEIEVSIGAALEGFSSTYPLKDEKKYYETNVNSFNGNIGLSYRHIYAQQVYSEIQIKYEFIDYKNKGITDLSGNAISVNLIIGFLSKSKERNEILKSLRYYK